MTSTHICVGGPLDGQYRAMPDGVLSFRVASLPPANVTQWVGDSAVPKLDDLVVEYQLVWSSQHGRFVWFHKGES